MRLGDVRPPSADAFEAADLKRNQVVVLIRGARYGRKNGSARQLGFIRVNRVASLDIIDWYSELIAPARSGKNRKQPSYEIARDTKHSD